MKRIVTVDTLSFSKAMKLSVTVFLGLMLMAVMVRPKTYLVETVDNADDMVIFIFI